MSCLTPFSDPHKSRNYLSSPFDGDESPLIPPPSPRYPIYGPFSTDGYPFPLVPPPSSSSTLSLYVNEDQLKTTPPSSRPSLMRNCHAFSLLPTSSTLSVAKSSYSFPKTSPSRPPLVRSAWSSSFTSSSSTKSSAASSPSSPSFYLAYKTHEVDLDAIKRIREATVTALQGLSMPPSPVQLREPEFEGAENTLQQSQRPRLNSGWTEERTNRLDLERGQRVEAVVESRKRTSKGGGEKRSSLWGKVFRGGEVKSLKRKREQSQGYVCSRCSSEERMHQS